MQLRDLRYAGLVDTKHEIAVLVETDPVGNLRRAELVWASDLRGK